MTEVGLMSNFTDKSKFVLAEDENGRRELITILESGDIQELYGYIKVSKLLKLIVKGPGYVEIKISLEDEELEK